MGFVIFLGCFWIFF